MSLTSRVFDSRQMSYTCLNDSFDGQTEVKEKYNRWKEKRYLKPNGTSFCRHKYFDFYVFRWKLD